MMDARAALEVLAAHRGDKVVVTTMSASPSGRNSPTRRWISPTSPLP